MLILCQFHYTIHRMKENNIETFVGVPLRRHIYHLLSLCLSLKEIYTSKFASFQRRITNYLRNRIDVSSLFSQINKFS